MARNNIIPVILCGGSGTRLWPLSRQSYPKQYLSPTNNSERSLFQDTLFRLEEIPKISNPIIICNEENRFITAEQLRKINIKPRNIFLEPFRKNTCPAITLSVLEALKNEDDPYLLVLASDHLIKDIRKFQNTIRAGIKYADQGRLVTFGIIPDYTETGYGYIETNVEYSLNDFKGISIKKFIEKPNRDKAKEFIKDKHYLWNSGMFLFKAEIVLNELIKYKSDIVKACKESLLKSSRDFDFTRIDKQSFEKCEEISFDFAVMEKTNLGTVLPLDVGWNDIGSWRSLWSYEAKDSLNNVLVGNVISENNQNCYIRSEERLVVGRGLSNLIVVETRDAVLICDINDDQGIKEIVGKLIIDGYEEGINNKLVYRPWGNFISLAEDINWKVKRIEINVGASISLQLHRQRSEHWVVVEGEAVAQIQDKKFNLVANQSIFIPLGMKHRLTNSGKNKLVIIEVQTGNYLGEDDIFRFEDNYGRY